MSDETILITLAQMTLNRFKTARSVYGVLSPTQSVSETKSAIWQTFFRSLWLVLALLFFSMHVYRLLFLWFMFSLYVCFYF